MAKVFNLRRVSSLRPFVSCIIAKMELSLFLIKLRIISLNFQEWHFDTQKTLSTSFKFLKKDRSCNCADTKQNCVFLPFPSDLFCVSLLPRNKNYMLLILIFIVIYAVFIFFIESAKLRALRALPIYRTRLTRLCALPIINTCLTCLTPLRALRALSAFVLSCVVLLQLKGKLNFVCSLQLTIHLFSLLFYHIKLFACFFSFFYFKPLVTPLFIQLFCSII